MESLCGKKNNLDILNYVSLKGAKKVGSGL